MGRGARVERHAGHGNTAYFAAHEDGVGVANRQRNDDTASRALDPLPSVLPPVTIAPRPRPSTRVPAPASLGPLSMRGKNATDRMGPTAVGRLGASDDPTIEVSFQLLEEALFDLVEGSGPEDPDAEDPAEMQPG